MKLQTFIDRCREIGCDPQLRRRLVLYVDDPTGSRINLGTISKDGKVEIWGPAVRDRQLGAPIGRQYMDRVAGFLPESRIKEDFDDPGSWHLRQYGRTGVSLGELLLHEEDWFAAIREVIDRFRALERAQDMGPAASISP